MTDRSPGTRPPNDDLVYEALADRHRRLAIRYLADRDGPVSLSALAAHITDAAAEESPDSTERATHEREVLTRLYHQHAPKLADAGLVRFDTEANEVEFAADSCFDAVLARLDE